MFLCDVSVLLSALFFSLTLTSAIRCCRYILTLLDSSHLASSVCLLRTTIELHDVIVAIEALDLGVCEVPDHGLDTLISNLCLQSYCLQAIAWQGLRLNYSLGLGLLLGTEAPVMCVMT